MGFRAWLTTVNSYKDWKEVRKSIKESPLSYGIKYVLKIEEDCPFSKGSIVVAWSGDCTSSLEDLRPKKCIINTVLVDNFLELFPEWHENPLGPKQFGTYLKSNKQIRKHFKQKKNKFLKDRKK